jgi:queuine tRNA-ribosyltransferase
LDDCPPNDVGDEAMLLAINRTVAWAKRCKIEFDKQVKKRKSGAKKPLLFGVIQGGTNLELRKKCAEALFAIGFDGYGFGARHVDGEGKFLAKTLQFTAGIIPENKLRFGLGIGTPDDIIRCVKMGWDMFDCVIPTREARHGKLYSFRHPELAEGSRRSSNVRLKSMGSLHFGRDDGFNTVNITNAKFTKDFSPINKSSKFPELKQYTKAYLHHLFKTQEPLALRLATLNNLEFYLDLMAKLRLGIKNNQI